MARKIVIVGGVGGGATVAAQLRRQDKDAEILLIDKGEHIAFSNCGMPYYIGGAVKNGIICSLTQRSFSQNTMCISKQTQQLQQLTGHKTGNLPA